MLPFFNTTTDPSEEFAVAADAEPVNQVIVVDPSDVVVDPGDPLPGVVIADPPMEGRAAVMDVAMVPKKTADDNAHRLINGKRNVIPISVLLGVGSVAARFRKYLETSFVFKDGVLESVSPQAVYMLQCILCQHNRLKQGKSFVSWTKEAVPSKHRKELEDAMKAYLEDHFYDLEGLLIGEAVRPPTEA